MKLIKILFSVGAALVAGNVFAADECAKHDNIPVYCYDTIRSFIDVTPQHIQQYSDNRPNQPLVFPGAPYPNSFCTIGVNCSQDVPWFTGPNFPSPSRAEVTAKIHFNYSRMCSRNAEGCEQFRANNLGVRFELLADSRVLDTYIVGGPTLAKEERGANLWRILSNAPVSDLFPMGHVEYLNGVVDTGEKISVRATPLSGPNFLDGFGIFQITLNVTGLQ